MGMYGTAQGFINIAASGGRLWEAFCQELGVAQWLSDPRFATAAARRENKAELNDLIEKELLKDTGDSWVERFNAVGVPCGPVNTVAQTFSDPQVQHLGMATPVVHPTAGDISIIRNATNMEGVSSEIRMPSPLKGQHSKEVLLEFGFTEEEIEKLSSAGAIEVNPD
tara:strand:- start:501 stop:1001 length:501 start_codon:yes stop_codon:yes gene_type:complete